MAGALIGFVAFVLAPAVLTPAVLAQSGATRLERMLSAIDRIATAPVATRDDAIRAAEVQLVAWAVDSRIDRSGADRADLAAALVAGAVAICDDLPDDRALHLLDAAAAALTTLDQPAAEDRCAVALQQARRLSRRGQLRAAVAVLSAQSGAAPSARFHGPIVCSELGTMLRASGDLSAALESLARADATLCDRVPVDPIEFHAVTRCEIAGERGQVWLDLGRADLAAVEFERERALVGSTAPTATRFASHLHRVHLAMAQEDFDSALRMIDDARGDPAFAAELGAAAIAMLEVRAAQAAARGAIDDPARLPAARQRVVALREHLAVAERLGVEDRVLAWLAVARVGMLESDFAISADALARARTLVALDATAAPPLLRAQYCAMNAAQARRTSDPGALAAAQVELRAAIHDLLAAWDASPRPPSGVGFFHFANRADVVVEAIRGEIALDERHGAERGFDLLLEIERRARLARGAVATRLALQQVVLGEGEVLCSWLPCVEATLLFVVTRDDVRCFEAPGVTALRAAGRAVEDALEGGRDEAAVARTLFDVLFPSDARTAIVGATSITAHGLDLIRAPPLEAARDASGRVLGLQWPIARVPSLAWYDRSARESARSYMRTFVLYAAPEIPRAVRTARPELEEISLETARADEFERLHPGALRRSGADATLHALRSDLAAPPLILQFVTHGFLDPLDPRPGRLVLAGEEGLLDCAVAESLPAAELVVMAACRAGLGPIHRGDAGASDLAGAFLFGGSRVVVAPNADVRAGPALALLLDLQRRMREGDSPALALARARSGLLAAADGDLAERRRVAFAFRVDGLGQRCLRFDDARSHGSSRERTVRSLAIGALALILAVSVTRALRAR